jgi:HEAT repeat protein
MTDDKLASLRSLDALSPRGLAGKREYVQSLEARGDADAVALLVECLADESGYLRDLAEAALVRLGAAPQAVVPLLSHGLWYTRLSAARTLGRLGVREAAHPLARVTADPNHSVAHEACTALGRLVGAGAGVAVARALYRLGDAARAGAMRGLAVADREAARQVEDLFRHTEVMVADDGELLSEDAAVVRAADDGVAWDLLTRHDAVPAAPPAADAPPDDPPATVS